MPAAATSPSAPTATVAQPDHEVVIVGTGFSGIGAAIKLKEAGIEDFVVFDKAEELGGTWRENTYPGCACDVPSHLYSYSFARRSDWSRVFAEQPEIQAYLLEVARSHDVLPHVRLRTEALRVAWHEDLQRWVIETNRGTI